MVVIVREILRSGNALTALDIRAEQEEPITSSHVAKVQQSSDPQGFQRWRETNVRQEKQAELTSIVIRVPLGDISALQLRGAASVARQCASGVRLTNDQNLVLRSVSRAILPHVYDRLKDFNLAAHGAGKITDITRCPGADTCLSAITHSRGLVEALEKLCLNGLAKYADTSLSIKVSGCPNSCSQHHIADRGFFGMSVRVSKRYLPCYQVQPNQPSYQKCPKS